MIIQAVNCYLKGASGLYRYWRLRFPDGSISDDFVEVMELELRSAVGGARQDASGGGSASSSFSGNPASNAFDGNIGNAWANNTGAAANSWLANDLGSAKDIVEFYYLGHPSTASWGPETIVVEYSSDGSSWTTDTRWPTLSSLTWLNNQYLRVPRSDQVGARIRRGVITLSSTNSVGWANYTWREAITAFAVPGGNGNTVKIRIRSGSGSEGLAINKCYVGLKGTGALDFASTPVQVTFGGNNSITVAANTEINSDEITLTTTSSDTIVVSMYIASGSTANDEVHRKGGGTGGYKTGDNASTLSFSGYTGYQGYVTLLELAGAAF